MSYYQIIFYIYSIYLMESKLTYDRLIAFHRNQINPKEFPEHTLTFAYHDGRYGSYK